MKKISSESANISAENETQQEIAEWLKNVTFKKSRFGGVDEADVWKKIEELNALYEKLLIAERARNCMQKQKEGTDDE